MAIYKAGEHHQTATIYNLRIFDCKILAYGMDAIIDDQYICLLLVAGVTICDYAPFEQHDVLRQRLIGNGR
ncbi:MAG: hypothetical protein IKZ12_07265 [Alistipes sp.]|nr:hypothetical protein [Alistipes sp.]